MPWDTVPNNSYRFWADLHEYWSKLPCLPIISINFPRAAISNIFFIMEKSKSWEPFRSYQLKSTANPAHLPQIWLTFEVNGLDWQCFLAGSFKSAPRIFIFPILLGAKYLSYVKFFAAYALTFFGCIISVLASVRMTLVILRLICRFDFVFLLECNTPTVWH